MSANTKRVFYVKYALDGKRPPRIVNRETWPHYAKRFERTFGFAPGRPALQRAGE
jgi:hypothetical protein